MDDLKFWHPATVKPQIVKDAVEENQLQAEYYPKISQGIPESVLSRIDQQNEQVRDENGRRWIKCEICGKIAPDSEFSFYGGRDHINLGVCYVCDYNEANFQ